MTEAQERFITYVRTKQFWQHRFRNIDPMNPIHIPMAEIKENYPNAELEELEKSGALEITIKETNSGYKAKFYRVLRAGGIKPSLLKPTGRKLSPLTEYMRQVLKSVSLKPDSPSTLYFDTFLMLKQTNLNLFFSVDEFSGRIHTPVSSFHREYRPNILLNGEETDSIDVVTMQPLLLGKILKNEIGKNEYSDWINSGEDIYLIIQNKTKLKTRDEAKKRFFEILFSKPNNQLAIMFGNTNWIEWINKFKAEAFIPNPHTIEKNHSNLAWLLQSTEVEMMSKLWQKLKDQDISFLSVHDEVIVTKKDIPITQKLFHEVLSMEFEYYKLSSKQSFKSDKPSEELPLKHRLIKLPTENWSLEISELEKFFSEITLPTSPIRLDQCSTILNVNITIQSHLNIVKAQNGNPRFSPYLNRLQSLKQILTIN